MKVTLFYSMHSKPCHSLIKIIREHGIDVAYVCVDSQEVRQRIKKGSLFKVTKVPTIAVLYDDEIELHEGPKAMEWIHMLIKSSQQQQYDYEDDIQSLPPSGNINMPAMGMMPSTQPNVKEMEMSNVKNLAKEMELERKRALGIKDE